MLTKDLFKTLFAYHWMTTLLMIESTAELSDTDLQEESSYGYGSILDLLFHLLNADNGWRIGLETGKQSKGIDQKEYADLVSLRNGFEREKQAWNKLLEGLEEEQIGGVIKLTNRRGNVIPFQYWRILQHLILHGMQHHSELAQHLTAKDCSPGNIDFIFYSE